MRYKVRNTQTGELLSVDESELGNYGLSPQGPTSAPTGQVGGTPAAMPPGGAMAGYTGQASPMGGGDQIRNMLMMAALSDLPNASKYAALMAQVQNPLESNMALAKYFQPTASQETDAAQAYLGIKEIDQMDKLLFSGSKDKKDVSPEGKKAMRLWKLRVGNIPVGEMIGGDETKLYARSAKDAYDILMRTRTGAALNMDEQQFYDTFVPGFEDSPTSANNKLVKLKELYEMVYQQGQQPLDVLMGGQAAVNQRFATPNPLNYTGGATMTAPSINPASSYQGQFNPSMNPSGQPMVDENTEAGVNQDLDSLMEEYGLK